MGATKSKSAGAKKRMSAAARALVGERTGTFRLAHIRAFAGVLFDEDLHAKRVESLANGVAGVLNAAMMTIHTIGQAYAAIAHIEARSGVKQLDRLLEIIPSSLCRSPRCGPAGSRTSTSRQAIGMGAAPLRRREIG
jgi:hypothetical protein